VVNALEAPHPQLDLRQPLDPGNRKILMNAIDLEDGSQLEFSSCHQGTLRLLLLHLDGHKGLYLDEQDACKPNILQVNST
jgi:hypothetical protein